MCNQGRYTAFISKIPCTSQNSQLGEILSYAIQLKNNGRADGTVKTVIARLKRLADLCNLKEPEQVKATIANMPWRNSFKNQNAIFYNGYLEYLTIPWTMPHYAKESQIPFIPTEAEIDTLIHVGRPKTSTLLLLLKETGARIGEIEKLKWQHIDIERRTIYITAEKGSNSRLLPISPKLAVMLNNLPKINDKVFQPSRHGLRITFESLRDRTAKKLNNPRLKQIHFHTFRHWKGTMEYHKTKDIIHVKTVLGHKRIESTMIYINIEQALFLTENDEWNCKTAKDINEATQLIESGFEYITDLDGLKLFRKRK